MSNQIIAATVLNLKMLPKRWGSSLIACTAIACVVLILIAILTVTESFRRLMVAGTYPSSVLILRHGARLETDSTLDRSAVERISGYANTQVEGTPVSAELMRAVRAKRPNNGDFVDIEMRGVTLDATQFRRGFRITQGRMFRSGQAELIVGNAAQDQYSGLRLGSMVRLVNTDWRIVGVFEASGSAAESEVWTALSDLQSTTHQEGAVQSIRMRVPTDAGRKAMQHYLDGNPVTNDFVQSEAQYYERTVRDLRNVMRKFAVPVFVIMVWSALFVSLNTMYGNVVSRGKELSTLRAMGFRAAPLIEALVIESIVLAAIGGLTGIAVAAFAIQGMHGNSNFLGDTQYSFTFVVSSHVLLLGLVCALAIGAVGGLAPALIISRSTPAQGIRGTYQ